MKKLFLTITALLLGLLANAQQPAGIMGNNNWFANWTNFKPKNTEYNPTTHILTGVIDANITLYKKNTYLLLGVVYVPNNVSITIEPGTVIRGDFATCGTLVVAKGAKIIANGLETDPIVFTSNKGVAERKPGDWGGIVLLGDAPMNKYGGIGLVDFNIDQKYAIYGGDNIDSNSGILKYVRVEFSGRKLNAQKELNGITFAGVGAKTTIENLQVSFSNDDSFEFYGGNVKVKNLISFRATDDDFDFTQGTQCEINNSIAVRYPYSSDASRSRCFEIDSYDKIENYDSTRKMTNVVANNISMVNNEDDVQGLVKEAIYVKSDAYLTMSNSLVSGFEKSLLMDDKSTDYTGLEKIKLNQMLFNNCKENIVSESGKQNAMLEEWYSNDKFDLKWSKTNKNDLFIETDTKKPLDLRLKISNIVTSRLAAN